jgi:adenosylcobinamide-phosphate synthase
MSAGITLLALLIEAMLGYPDGLVILIGHPVTWIGAEIAWLDRTLNRPTMTPSTRRLAGFLALVAIVSIPAGVAYAIERAALTFPFGTILLALLASTLIAQRSLHAHVARVALELERDDLERARLAVAQLVGRDTRVLDEAGTARAAIESLAENFSDGIVAPVFWMMLLGLPGATAYKAINTADSMIGHRTPRHAEFGFAAARLDDLVNLPASRFSALLIILAALLRDPRAAAAGWRALRRDAHRHRSPNAGYPEAAMAGALGLELAGPRVYGGICVDDAMMGVGRRDASAKDIRAALSLYRCADILLIIIVGAIAGALRLAQG